ncbi:MAG: hypothetical protein K2X82_17475 [Gemmataceae bacterium]|nr:hypothetical protein [Gemmataceae bacterium]
MTAHELAALLDSLRAGLADWFGADTRKKFVAAAEGLRELPDEGLKKIAERVRKGGAGDGVGGRAPGLVESIRAAQAGEPPPEAARSAVEKLTVKELDEVLKAFGQSASGKKPEKLARALALFTTGAGGPPSPPPAFDPAVVEEGVRIFTRLRDDRTLSINQVQAGFAPLRAYPRAVIEEISRRLEYTPNGSGKDIAERLWRNLEGIKASQYRSEMILTGT